MLHDDEEVGKLLYISLLFLKKHPGGKYAYEVSCALVSIKPKPNAALSHDNWFKIDPLPLMSLHLPLLAVTYPYEPGLSLRHDDPLLTEKQIKPVTSVHPTFPHLHGPALATEPLIVVHGGPVEQRFSDA